MPIIPSYSFIATTTIMMIFTTLTLAAGLVSAIPSPNFPNAKVFLGAQVASPINGMTFHRINALSLTTNDLPIAHTQRLTSLGKKPTGRSAAHITSTLRKRYPISPGSPSSIASHGFPWQNISAIDSMSAQYSIDIDWNGQAVSLLFDTGSSDTWAVSSDFTCRTAMGIRTDQEECLWGPNLVDSFAEGSKDPELHFAMRYGSGEKVSGPMGKSNITLAGMTVKDQLVGLANDTYWYGNNMTNGIMGMAFPALTSGYGGSGGSGNGTFRTMYQPIFSNMVTQGLLEPVFSVSLEKSSGGGVIGWGGIPVVDWSPQTIAETDILIASVSNFPDASSQYTFYTIITDGIQYNQVQDSRKYLYIIDTGTTLVYLPPKLAEAIAESFNPAAVYLFQYGAYFAPCDAQPPRLAVIIGGVKIWINPADLIYQDFQDPSTGYCAIGVTTGGDGPYILGDVFLQSVMAVFNIGSAQMRFYGRYH